MSSLYNRKLESLKIALNVYKLVDVLRYALLFRIANGELLGPDVPIQLTAIELPPAMKALQGVEMELTDCAFPLLDKLTITDDPEAGFEGCEIALLVGSKPRGPGMERYFLFSRLIIVFDFPGFNYVIK